MYDAIVIGARCAGSPTAMLLARRGYRVLLLDKAGFPSDTMSTHYIHQPGMARLKRWGLMERVVESNCPPFRRMRFDVGPFALEGLAPPAGDIAYGYAPRRRVLDNILVEAGVQAGVELREHFTVKELISDGERVTGIRGHAAGGATVTEQARIVIGADGMRSFVARSVQAPSYNVRPSLTCAYYSYWSDLPLAGAELYPRPDRMIILGLTNDGQTSVTVFWPNAAFTEVRTNVERHFMQALEIVPGLAERVRSGKRTEQFYGSGDLPFFFRKPFGPGWALVGDAGYHKDPITAQGITDSFRDAELLSQALDAGLSGRRPLDAALAEYEQQRNEAAMPLYEFTHQLASLAPPAPEMQQLFAALRDNPEQSNRFFGLIAGTVSIPEFFAPENLGRIIDAEAPIAAA
jgi:2-polyprenyl-6-methoxyphenol hydroxylase-like FAD-dependent oxidoreductase